MNHIDWKSGSVKLTAIILPCFAIASAAYINLANQTAIAIEVAKQHGAELLAIRQEVTELRGAVITGMDDRFRRKDWQLEKEFIMHLINELERRTGKLEEASE